MKNEGFKPFDIKESLEEIKKEYHGAEGLEKIKDLKETWRFQKLGLAEIQKKALDTIEEQRDSFRSKDFLKANEELFDKYLLTPEMRTKIRKVLNICERRVKKIKLLQDKHSNEAGELDKEAFFEEIFKMKPQGEIDVIIRPLSLYFKMRSPEDFALIYTGKNLTKKSLKPGDLDSCQGYAGAKMEKASFPELKGGVIIESPEGFDRKDYSKEILRHEEHHVINDLMLRVHLSDLENAVKIIKNLGIKDPEKVVDLSRNAKIESQVKDEISAHFTDNEIIKNISLSLLVPETIYTYGYDYNESETEGNYMHPDYFKVAQNGIIAMANLKLAGYDDRTSQALLMSEALQSWPKVVDRIIGERRSAERKKEDLEKNIDKDILRLSEEAKEYV